MWGFPKLGVPQMACIYKGKPHLEMDDDWGYPYDLGHLHVAL